MVERYEDFYDSSLRSIFDRPILKVNYRLCSNSTCMRT